MVNEGINYSVNHKTLKEVPIMTNLFYLSGFRLKGRKGCESVRL